MADRLSEGTHINKYSKNPRIWFTQIVWEPINEKDKQCPGDFLHHQLFKCPWIITLSFLSMGLKLKQNFCVVQFERNRLSCY